MFLGPLLEQGRAKLVEEQGGKRTKLKCSLGNEIDTMFVDRRKKNFANGDTLVSNISSLYNYRNIIKVPGFFADVEHCFVLVCQTTL